MDAFLRPEAILDIVHERADLPDRGLVVFCGTYVSVTGTIEFGTEWSFRMVDPVLGREIAHGYRVERLFEDIHPDFRVPVRAPAP